MLSHLRQHSFLLCLSFLQHDAIRSIIIVVLDSNYIELILYNGFSGFSISEFNIVV